VKSAALPALLVSLAMVLLSGCGNYHHFTGHSGTCRYGLGAGVSGLGCYKRPGASDQLKQQAMSPATLARAIAAWRRGHGAADVTSVGINWWAETSISTGDAFDKHPTTFDVHGRRTHGNDGYVLSPHDPFPIGAVQPGDYGRLLARIRAGQPDTRIFGAVLDVDPFSRLLTWRVSAVSTKAKSDVLYEAAEDGTGLCHATDYRPKDSLVPAPGVPLCPNGAVIPF
jgi:hypothetical protein